MLVLANELEHTEQPRVNDNLFVTNCLSVFLPPPPPVSCFPANRHSELPMWKMRPGASSLNLQRYLKTNGNIIEI